MILPAPWGPGCNGAKNGKFLAEIRVRNGASWGVDILPANAPKFRGYRGESVAISARPSPTSPKIGDRIEYSLGDEIGEAGWNSESAF